MNELLDSDYSVSSPEAFDGLSSCQMAVGFVIFDCLALAFGALGLRATVRPSTIAQIVRAAAPEMVAIEAQVAIIAHEASTAFQRATSVFSILGTLWAGGMLGAVFKAFKDSITWLDGLLYGTMGIASILAALATDGVSFCAQVVLLLGSFTYLLMDAQKAVTACLLTTQEGPTPGNTQSPSPNPMPYLPQIALMTAKGYFVTVKSNVQADADAAFSTNRTSVGDWEKFTIEMLDMEDHTFALKTADGRYVTARNGGGQSGAASTSWALSTDATTISRTENVILQMQTDGTYALMTPKGYYVTANLGGNRSNLGEPMRTTATVIGPYEVFTFQTIQNDGMTAHQVKQSSPSLIVDASFETPSLGYGNFMYKPSHSAWIFSPYAGISANHSGFTNGNPPAPYGVQVAFIQREGTISQTVVFAAGVYEISFYAAQRANYESNTFQVLVDGELVGTFTPQTGGSYQFWRTGTFVVTAGSHTIMFKGTNPTGKDTTCFIDQVSISVSPPVAAITV